MTTYHSTFSSFKQITLMQTLFCVLCVCDRERALAFCFGCNCRLPFQILIKASQLRLCISFLSRVGVFSQELLTNRDKMCRFCIPCSPVFFACKFAKQKSVQTIFNVLTRNREVSLFFALLYF